jgi:D-beta-D-heptose 7-phosphate kinase/D-beta-D-heptose 1-phosphate adenosyltransferase
VQQVSGRRLSRLVGSFPKLRVLVVGDFMLDQFVFGQVRRISPEAPVPVVRMTGEEFRAGGAGNVVSNVRAMGGRVVAAGVVGRDASGRQLAAALRSTGADVGGLIESPLVATIRKTRIIAHQQQLVRVDREDGRALDGRVAARLLRDVLGRLDRHAAVVVSDYGKGTITPPLLATLAARQRQRPFVWIVDPKRTNFDRYRGATVVKPNLEEASAASGIEITDRESLCEAGRRLLELWQSEAVLISRGEDGMSLFKRPGVVRHFGTAARDVYDVTGAGDTAIAACALALAAGGSFEEAAVLANLAAGVAVAHVGTVAVTAAQLRQAIRAGEGAGICAA